MIKKSKRFLFPTEEDDLYLEDENIEETKYNEEDENLNPIFTPKYQQESKDKKINDQLETKIFKPKRFVEAKEIMENMLKLHSVIVDISDLINSELGQKEAEKIICYLCGVSDSIGFEVKKINVSTFFFQSKLTNA